MYKIIVNEDTALSTEVKDGRTYIDGTAHDIDMSQLSDHQFQILKNDKVYNAEIVELSNDHKHLTIKLNGKLISLEVKDSMDLLLEKLGIEHNSESVVKDVKAPMPGLIIDVTLEAGQEVKKGDALLILEAMKMENVIKSPTDGTISKVLIKKGESVEKNQILVEF
ncbi:MAG: acetyl-CoA carboxylase biotin carboxyl carrier protein subunit [Cyclobacteriaceae bacterium]